MFLLLLCALALPHSHLHHANHVATAAQFHFDEHLYKSQLTASLEEEACRDICPACYQFFALHLANKMVELARYHAHDPDAIIEYIKQFLPSGYKYDPLYPETKHTTALSEDGMYLTSNPDENQVHHYLFRKAVELSPDDLFARANMELEFMRQVAKASFLISNQVLPLSPLLIFLVNLLFILFMILLDTLTGQVSESSQTSQTSQSSQSSGS
jgi:hypothetical protein